VQCKVFQFYLQCNIFWFNLKCSVYVVSSMLVGTAFYLIHRFAHILKFRNDDVLNIAKVYPTMYVFNLPLDKHIWCDVYNFKVTFTGTSCFFILQHILNRWSNLISRPVSSVGRAPDCCAGYRKFKPRPDQHSGSLNNWGERAAFAMTPANG